MSTDFRPERNIFARDLFDGRLAKFGVHEWRTPHEYRTRGLTDGRDNYLCVMIDDDGSVEFTTHNYYNDPYAILAAVAKAFETEIFSEHDPQYWGCKTNEEFLDTYYPRGHSTAAKKEIELKAEAQHSPRQVRKTGPS